MSEHSASRRGALAQTLALAAGAVAASGAAAAPAPAAGAPAYRVVFQVSDADQAKWQMTLNNARNVQQDLGAANVAIEIVAFGPGIGMLKSDSPVAARLDEAIQAGVAAHACQNTMRALKLDVKDLAPKVTAVSSGAAAIVKRQAEGWAYIRS